jgi:carbonic anhydrase
MPVSRRSFLRAAAISCACCAGWGRASAEQLPVEHGAKGGAHAHWSYSEAGGPEHWGDLSPNFKMCQLGLEQTPIDLSHGLITDPGTFALDYHSFPLKIVNNGHTIQVNADPGSSCIVRDTKYALLQFHFHHPSEHLLGGKPLDLECHFVHKSGRGDLAVAGVLFKLGGHNAALQTIFGRMPKQAGQEVTVSEAIDPLVLFPTSRAYFRYMGSLTTPPCSEGITWTVFKEPLEISLDQVKQFAALFPNNARPAQRINRRFLIETN